MKQLKVIKNSIDTQKSSIIQASFNDTIVVQPNSRIWLDKLQMTILSGNTTGIFLPEQFIQLSTNATNDESNVPFRTITIPSGNYTTIQALIVELNNRINGILNSNPVQFSNSQVTDIGLFVLVSEDITDKSITIQYSGVNVEPQTLTNITDCSVTTVSSVDYYDPDSNTSPYSVVFPRPLINGALQVLFKMIIPATIGTNILEFGIYPDTTTTSSPYFTVKLDAGIWYYGNFGTYEPFDDQTIFSNANSTGVDNYYCFYIDPNDAGKLRFGLFNVDTHTAIGLTSTGAYAGFIFNDEYYYQIRGNQNSAVTPVLVGVPDMTCWDASTFATDAYGNFVVHTGFLPKNYIGSPELSLGAYPDIPQLAVPRTMAFDFTAAQFLANGLGFSQLAFSYAGISNTITGTELVGFVNYFDMALDILNIPLQSYISSEAQTGRSNTLVYFTPVRLDSNNNNVYVFENKNLTFLDIQNIDKFVIESLQFRLYNVSQPNAIFNIQGLSFNLFIEDGDTEKPF